MREHTCRPLTLSPLLKLISRSPAAECDRVATKTRPGTALYRRLRWPAVCPAAVAVAGAGAGAGLGGRGEDSETARNI